MKLVISLIVAFMSLTGSTNAQIMEGTFFSKPIPAIAPTWVFVQTGTNFSCASGTTCAVSMSATTANSILIAMVTSATATHVITTSTTGAGGTWTVCAACTITISGGPGTASVATNLTGTGGATSITVAINTTTTSWSAVVGEWKCTANCGDALSIDNGPNVVESTPSCTTTCIGSSLAALTGTSDLIVQIIAYQTPSVPSPGAPYVYDPTNDFAYAENYTTTTAPTLPQATAGPYAVSAIAFK